MYQLHIFKKFKITSVVCRSRAHAHLPKAHTVPSLSFSFLSYKSQKEEEEDVVSGDLYLVQEGAKEGGSRVEPGGGLTASGGL